MFLLILVLWEGNKCFAYKFMKESFVDKVFYGFQEMATLVSIMTDVIV